ncbi:MAG: hypothetical protein HYV16_16580 [Gammaproteobacteria bacterium]|nr:hypothetical protein [Gammaproteobacteria bacterium]
MNPTSTLKHKAEQGDRKAPGLAEDVFTLEPGVSLTIDNPLDQTVTARVHNDSATQNGSVSWDIAGHMGSTSLVPNGSANVNIPAKTAAKFTNTGATELTITL